MIKSSDSITEKITPGKKVPSPSEFLKQAFGRQVTVKLIHNVEYKGIIDLLRFTSLLRWSYEFGIGTS